jgi:hypothetical protein
MADRAEEMMAVLYQKRHYEDTARILREAKANLLVGCRSDTLAAWEAIVITFAQRFRRDNERFNATRFFAACGSEQA